VTVALKKFNLQAKLFNSLNSQESKESQKKNDNADYNDNNLF